MKHTQPQPEPPSRPADGAGAPQGLELRHLRYFVAVADAGTFTHAAERLFIAQPALSQQIRRLEQVVGTPLLHRGRGGVQLTGAGTMLLDAARDVLSHGRTWGKPHPAGGGPGPAAAPVCHPAPPARGPHGHHRLGAAVGGRCRRRGRGLDGHAAGRSVLAGPPAPGGRRPGWLTASPDALPAQLDAMSLGEFEPDLWIPASHPAARRGSIGLDQLASMDVIFGPRRAEPGTYDAWTSIVRARNPRFEFTDPPLRHSLPVVLAFAATAGRPAAVLTGPAAIAGPPPGVIRLPRLAGTGDMARVSIAGHPLTATAALVWHGDLPRPLQQILFNTADALTPPPPASLSRAG